MSPETQPPLIESTFLLSRQTDLSDAEKVLHRVSGWRPKLYRRAGSLVLATSMVVAGLPHLDTLETAATFAERTVEVATQPVPTFEFRQYSAEQALMSTYQTYHLRDGYYIDTINSPGSFASTWSQYQLLDMFNIAATSGVKLSLPINDELNKATAALDTYWSASPEGFLPGYNATITYGVGKPDRYVDDNLWMAQFLVRRYKQTGDKTYLSKVNDILNLFMSQRSPVSHAAFWKVQFPSEKNRDQCMVSNVTAIPTLVEMARLGFGDDTYIDAAEQAFAWAQQLRDPVSGLYYDKIMGNGQIDKTIYTYGQGEVIESLMALHEVNPQQYPLGDAVAFAKKTTEYFSRRGGYGISKFDVIYLKSLMRLSAKTNDPELIAETKQALMLARKLIPVSPTNLADTAGNTAVILLAGLPITEWSNM